MGVTGEEWFGKEGPGAPWSAAEGVQQEGSLSHKMPSPCCKQSGNQLQKMFLEI